MHINIIGGGIVGISTAWALLARGHTVDVFEANDATGLETSFANGGMLTAGMSEPWNAPGVWKDLIKSLADPHAAMKLNPTAVPGMTLWGLKFLAQSTQARFTANTQASYALCAYSVGLTGDLVSELDLACDYRKGGDLKIYPTEDSVGFSLEIAAMVQGAGLRMERLSRDEVIAKEPTLAPIADRIACGLYYPDDTAGDAHQFTQSLAGAVQQAGGRVHLKTPIARLMMKNGKCVGVETDNGTAYLADLTVIAAANASPKIAKQAGVRLPIRPVKGYSLTFDVSHVDDRPQLAVIDQAMHAAVNPFGTRLRVAGTAEFTRKPEPVLSQARVDNLYHLLQSTYPEIAAQVRQEDGLAWCGFRPMSVDGKPFIGESGVDGLFINSGHGYLGWTQASGSAAMLADMIDGKPTAIDPTPYRVRR